MRDSLFTLNPVKPGKLTDIVWEYEHDKLKNKIIDKTCFIVLLEYRWNKRLHDNVA